MASASSAPSIDRAKTPKFPTHLAMTGDVLLGSVTTDNCVHDIEATVYDSDENPHPGSLNIWARDQPAEGLYLLCNVPCATEPLRIAVSEPTTMRLVPEEVDGSSASGICLPPGPIFFTGVGLTESVDADRKGGMLVGWTYMGKKVGWIRYRIRAFFENTTKWIPWYMSQQNSLVAFDLLFYRINENDIVECLIRRLTVLDGNHSNLLQSVGATSTKAHSRGEKLKEIKAAKKALAAATGASSEPEASTTDAINTCPPAPKAERAGHVAVTPPSPTPAHQTRKRGRLD
ncbi:hypothetical protein OC835_007412 [Tilletia horrida]|nr:hypothetical protein OC835_007412 [Tilletia horrida]